MENKSLSLMTVDETYEFVSNTLEFPELAEKFKEQDLDGACLLELDAALIKVFLPTINLQQCLLLLRKLKSFKQCSSRTTLPASSLQLHGRTNVSGSSLETCAKSGGVSSLPDISSDLESAEGSCFDFTLEDDVLSPNNNDSFFLEASFQDTSPAASSEEVSAPCAPNNALPIAQPTKDNALIAVSAQDNAPAVQHAHNSKDQAPVASSPVSKSPSLMVTPADDFPIRSVKFPPEALKVIETGEPSISGKSAISTSIVTHMLTLSTSSCYVSYEMKRKAAIALVMTFPKLQFGMGSKEAVDAWHHTFSLKLKNWRKRGKITGDEIQIKKKIYKTQATNGSKVNQSPSVTKRKAAASLFAVEEQDEEETTEQQKKILELELTKLRKDQNKKLIKRSADITFPLRRKFLSEAVHHTSAVIKEWPCLKLNYVLLDELCRIHPTAYNFQTFQMLLSDCSPKILALAIKKKFSSRHPLGKILQCVENDNSNKELQLVAVLMAMCYLLPTSAKKTLYAHQYLIDLVAKTEEIDLPSERRQPFVLLLGSSYSNLDKIVIFSDTIAVCTCDSISEAVYLVFSLYYSLNIEYSFAVYPALQFLQLKCLNIEGKARLSVHHFIRALEKLQP